MILGCAQLAQDHSVGVFLGQGASTAPAVQEKAPARRIQERFQYFFETHISARLGWSAEKRKPNFEVESLPTD